jgi:iron only hydrogenase large subunit-like protein
MLGLFHELGADHTIVITVAEDISLLESGNEFLRNFDNKLLPILTGICPGWVCYGEKLHQHSLPKISKVKSPQQIMGSLLKLMYGKKANFTPDQIYHVTLMSCFDRKLESSRKDFFIEEYKAREVDVVITAIEVEQILEKLNKSLEDFDRVPLVDLFHEGMNSNNPFVGCNLMSHFGSGSGGYAEFVLRHSAKILFGKEISQVEWKVGRYAHQFRDF